MRTIENVAQLPILKVKRNLVGKLILSGAKLCNEQPSDVSTNNVFLHPCAVAIFDHSSHLVNSWLIFCRLSTLILRFDLIVLHACATSWFGLD